MITRRQTLQLLGTAAVAAYFATSLPALAQNVAESDLAVQGPLGDVAVGPENAKVTIIEYASLTCSHCANFHKTTWPELKKRYIDTGKVRFVLREFPLDPLATAGQTQPVGGCRADRHPGAQRLAERAFGLRTS